MVYRNQFLIFIFLDISDKYKLRLIAFVILFVAFVFSVALGLIPLYLSYNGKHNNKEALKQSKKENMVIDNVNKKLNDTLAYQNLFITTTKSNKLLDKDQSTNSNFFISTSSKTIFIKPAKKNTFSSKIAASIPVYNTFKNPMQTAQTLFEHHKLTTTMYKLADNKTSQQTIMSTSFESNLNSGANFDRIKQSEALTLNYKLATNQTTDIVINKIEKTLSNSSKLKESIYNFAVKNAPKQSEIKLTEPQRIIPTYTSNISTSKILKYTKEKTRATRSPLINHSKLKQLVNFKNYKNSVELYSASNSSTNRLDMTKMTPENTILKLSLSSELPKKSDENAFLTQTTGMSFSTKYIDEVSINYINTKVEAGVKIPESSTTTNFPTVSIKEPAIVPHTHTIQQDLIIFENEETTMKIRKSNGIATTSTTLPKMNISKTSLPPKHNPVTRDKHMLFKLIKKITRNTSKIKDELISTTPLTFRLPAKSPTTDRIELLTTTTIQSPTSMYPTTLARKKSTYLEKNITSVATAAQILTEFNFRFHSTTYNPRTSIKKSSIYKRKDKLTSFSMQILTGSTHELNEFTTKQIPISMNKQTLPTIPFATKLLLHNKLKSVAIFTEQKSKSLVTSKSSVHLLPEISLGKQKIAKASLIPFIIELTVNLIKKNTSNVVNKSSFISKYLERNSSTISQNFISNKATMNIKSFKTDPVYLESNFTSSKATPLSFVEPQKTITRLQNITKPFLSSSTFASTANITENPTIPKIYLKQISTSIMEDSTNTTLQGIYSTIMPTRVDNSSQQNGTDALLKNLKTKINILDYYTKPSKTVQNLLNFSKTTGYKFSFPIIQETVSHRKPSHLPSTQASRVFKKNTANTEILQYNTQTQNVTTSSSSYMSSKLLYNRTKENENKMIQESLPYELKIKKNPFESIKSIWANNINIRKKHKLKQLEKKLQEKLSSLKEKLKLSSVKELSSYFS